MNRIFLSILFATAISFAASAQPKAQNDWAKFGRYAADNAELDFVPTAVFMGNSITDNWSNLVDPDFFVKHKYVGRGISGQTSSEMLVRFRTDVIDLHPKVVVILAGTNDVAQNNGYISLENVVKNIVSMCELAKANKIKVVLCSVLPSTKFLWRPEIEPQDKIVELNKLIKAYADKHKIVYVDFHSAMRDEQNGLPAGLSKDGCHPTIDGYKIMEPLVIDGIKKARLPK